MKRKIYNEMLLWKLNAQGKSALMIDGARRIGKSYIVEEFAKNEYKSYILVDFNNADDNLIEIFDKYLRNLDVFFSYLALYYNVTLYPRDTVIVFDEVQLYPKARAAIKYLVKDGRYDYIETGSLVSINRNVKDIVIPSEEHRINMYPMDFEEFLLANNRQAAVELLKEYYEKNKPLGSPLHEEMLRLYRIYLLTGGMPEAVQNIIDVKQDYSRYNTDILKNILNSYYKDMKKHVINDAEALKIERIYNSLPPQLTNASKKFQFSMVGADAKKDRFETAIDWLIASHMIIKCDCVNLPEIPLAGFVDNETYKFYLSDVGILCSILGLSVRDIVTDNISLYKGIITENFVANQLICNGFRLFYWKSDATAEVDFLLYTSDGIIPLEVKSSDNTQSKSLKVYMNKYNPKYAIRVSTKDFGFDPNTKIKSVPLYAAFLIKE